MTESPRARIRHFGLCAGRNLYTKLEAARRMLASLTASPAPAVLSGGKDERSWWKRFLDRTGIDLLVCPHCALGRLVRRRQIEPFCFLLPTGAETRFANSS